MHLYTCVVQVLFIIVHNIGTKKKLHVQRKVVREIERATFIQVNYYCICICVVQVFIIVHHIGIALQKL